MFSDLGAVVEATGAVGEWLSGSASALAFLAYLTEFVRGKGETRSFRPMAGWVTAILGVTAAGAAAVTLRERAVLPWVPDGRLLGVTLLVGVVLVVLGVSAALLTPSADLSTLREIAAAAEAAATARRYEAEEGLGRSDHVELDLDVTTKPAWSGDSRASRVRGLSTARMPTASVSVVVGPAGSGKSVTLRHLTSAVSRRVRRARRPREVAVHVSLRAMPAIEGRVDQDTIREHLVRSVSGGNSALGVKLRAYLDGGGGPRWLFVFDLDAEATREREVEYFEALRNFMRHRDRDRAVMAVRTRFPDAQPVFTVRRPSRVQIRELMREQGIDATDRVVPREPDLADLLATPEMVVQFARHVVDGNPGSDSVDVVESFVANRLATLSGDSTARRERVEEVAFRIITDVPRQVVPDRDVAPLRKARLGRVERGAFAFRFPVLGTHLAAGHVVRERLALPVVDLARTEATRALLLAVLRRADDEYAATLVHEITAVIEARSDRFGTSAVTSLPPLGSFRWQPEVLHLLFVLRDAIRLRAELSVPSRLQDRTDQLIWSAVFGGGRHERDAAFELLPLASPGHVLELYRQAKSLGYDVRTTSAAALYVELEDENTRSPTYVERLTMVNDVLTAWRIAPLPLSSAAAGKPFRRMIEALTSTASATAAGWGIAMFAVAMAADQTNSAFVFVGVAVVLLCVSSRLLVRVSAPGRVEAWLMRALVYLGIFLCLVPVALFVQSAVVALFTLDLLTLAKSLFFIWAFSWPPAMVAAVVHDPSGQHPWVLPHRKLRAVASGSRDEWIGYVDRARDRAALLRSAPRIAVLVLLAAVVAMLPVDLPVSGDVEQSIDYPAAIAVVVVFSLLLRKREAKSEPEPADVVARQIFTGVTTDKQLLAEIAERAETGFGELLHLFKALATVPPGALENCVHVLQSLDNLLEFLQRTLPVATGSASVVIQQGLWRYAPTTNPPELLDWVMEFDLVNGGFLAKLAYSEDHRELLSRAIRNATAELAASPDTLSDGLRDDAVTQS